MELRVLRYFLTVAREETATRAADILHITQPTLSRQLAQLEDDLGVKLFYHQGRKMYLTNEGMLLRRRAEEIFELVDKTEQELLEQEEQIEGTIVVGHGDYGTMDILADCMADFSIRYPRVRFAMFNGSGDVIKERMDRGLIDVGLLLEPISTDNYNFIRLSDLEQYAAFMRPEDPLAEKGLITPADLEGKPLIVSQRYENQVRNWMGPYFREGQIRYLITLPSMGAVLASKGWGYMLTIQRCLPTCDPATLVSRTMTGDLHWRSLLAWKNGQPFSRATEKFIEHAKCFLSINQTTD